ncbi:malate dehydrogenase (quinone) [Kurthia gibsonii]|uniref:malate dehydrogenase (quinone) n=1 Tax=Kurthia gibsonii TaxID=33946 RepID=UPI0011419AA9|nr:malate dehydrogenase (quinone) [Kurthia gibsonii]GED19808.1 putative malate:quinone oxidoreductase [Kurthia gibsonii]
MSNKQTSTDVILVGAGIMSATLGTILKELAPDWNIKVFEKLDKPGLESSNEWNNAGTGHSALCELNYTPEKNGVVETSKAVNVNEQFQVSRQFWSYLVENGHIQKPEEFIKPIPHLSMVQGEDNVAFLKKRFEALSKIHLFDGMEYSEDQETLKQWIPLIMNGRTSSEPIAATRIESGTDVNFGALTRILMSSLEEQNGVEATYNASVENIKQNADGRWEVKVKTADGKIITQTAKFVFLGAGGGSLHLLQKTGIPESKHIGGFPVSGLWLVCNNQEVADQHHGKVYSTAEVGAPPMSVPHLDTRYIDGKKALLFGPFAGFSPKFLKTGSNLDLFTSIKPNNIFTLLACGAKEMGLTKYLIQQLMLNKKQRVEELRKFVPQAKDEEWEIVIAGQRVQVIKDTDKGKGTLQFGTEVITGANGSVAALLGASPGASTAVQVMLDVINKCFPEKMNEWEPKIKEMIPSYGKQLVEDEALFKELHASTAKSLKLED